MDNPSLAQVGISQPLNRPVLDHVDLISGDVTSYVDPTDETRVKELAVSPDGTRLVATGNFATVNGQLRRRAFMLNLG